MPSDSIGVVTLTRHRHDLLRRAMASVYAQDYPGTIEHVVVIDDDPSSVPVVRDAPVRPGLRTVAHLVERSPRERDEPPHDRRLVYPRIARLFNTGVRVSSADWIAFLDDDNEFEPDHLTSLRECAERTGAAAVHSGRAMFHADGSPYLDELWHTAFNDEEGRRLYELMCERGVRVRGTNIVLDRADPVAPGHYRPSTVMGPDDPVMTVDQSVWLLRREQLLRLPIPERFTDEDYDNNVAPDDKLLHELVNNGVAIVNTGRPSVRYYLGGVSNRHQAEFVAGRPVREPV
ncbi:glycosyltransferase family 2 protein [Dactylosporangium sp. CA-139114]|uniref:glycosyltransferase family 2 protein n=1 Tax=Dactylosporangium sp. CA-139114 TaxID=3239931 RepID=UPI003D97C71B